MTDLWGADTGAQVSADGRYRWSLWRIWNHGLPFAFVCMLNPSKADAHTDDPTIRVLRSMLANLGFGGLYVGNQGAYIATDPRELFSLDAPTAVGDMNDTYLHMMADRCDTHVCAWGTRSLPGRAAAVLNIMRSHAKPGQHPMALALTQNGHPHHPLRLRRPDALVEFPRVTT